MLIVFDLDGTLIDGYAAITDALGFAMEQLGRETLPEDQVRAMVGEGLERLLEKAVGADLVSRGVPLFRERYALVLEEKTGLLPDVSTVLAQLAGEGHAMAVASNKPPYFSRRILEAKGVAERFRAIVGPDATMPPKPDPTMLVRLMDRLGATPDETVVVGDMEIDAQFARAASCRCVLVPGGSRSPEELARIRAHAHLSRLAELPKWTEQASRMPPLRSRS